jgi:hypothetical protein
MNNMKIAITIRLARKNSSKTKIYKSSRYHLIRREHNFREIQITLTKNNFPS